MTTFLSTNFERTKLSFSLEGLTSREDVLFKSLVRLLDHVTAQNWAYRPASTDYRVDLLVVAEWYPPMRYERPHPFTQPVLSIGSSAERDMHLSWPIQPTKLADLLNRMGAMAMEQQSSTSGAFFAAAGPADGLDRDLFRLKQWPPSRFLVGMGRMRLATLLSGRAMTLDELQRRSALPLAVCRAFTTDLQNAKLLVITASSHPLSPAYEKGPHELLNLPSAAVAFAKPGLFARIRAGLGIKSSHNA